MIQTRVGMISFTLNTITRCVNLAVFMVLARLRVGQGIFVMCGWLILFSVKCEFVLFVTRDLKVSHDL